jgi:alginate O-acetyltransferase complex protein AlgJ
MLFRYRRFLALAAFALLATPLAIGVVLPDGSASVLKEGRRPAPPPQAPGSFAAALALPGEIDAYLKDRFGLRRALIRAHRDLTKPVLASGDGPVLIGRDGRMFYLGDEMVRQSAGLVLRDQKVSDVVDLIGRMSSELMSRGVKFLVAMPPNSSTVYQDDLPFWAQNRGRTTEYDLTLRELADRGVKAIDLRSAVVAARAKGNVYLMHDTHWTERGALAAFNAIVEADGHPDWRLAPELALAPATTRKGGDLSRMLGLEDGVRENVEELRLPEKAKPKILSEGATPDLILALGEPGPTILILGDSFTQADFPQMLSQHVGRVVWLHYRHCAFDWRLIEKFRPDEVWWTPTERGLYCEPGARPLDFPAQNAASR